MVRHMFLLSKSIEKLIESLRCRQSRVAETKRETSSVDIRLAEDAKVASRGKGFRPIEVTLTMLLPLGGISDPHIAP